MESRPRPLSICGVEVIVLRVESQAAFAASSVPASLETFHPRPPLPPSSTSFLFLLKLFPPPPTRLQLRTVNQSCSWNILAGLQQRWSRVNSRCEPLLLLLSVVSGRGKVEVKNRLLREAPIRSGGGVPPTPACAAPKVFVSSASCGLWPAELRRPSAPTRPFPMRVSCEGGG